MMNKNILSIIMSLVLVGCATTPPTYGVTPVQMPDLPEELDKRYYALPPITDNTLAGQIRAETQATQEYNDVSFKYNKLVDLYNCMKPAINNVDQEALNECLGTEDEERQAPE